MQGNRQQTHLLTNEQNNFSDTDPAYPLFNITHISTKPLLATVELNEAPVDMEVDTRVSVSLISKVTYDKLWPNLTTAPPLQKSYILLRTYTGEHLDVVGSVYIDVRYTRNILPISPRLWLLAEAQVYLVEIGHSTSNWTGKPYI